mgnify:CR=1 FL=1
MTHDKYIEILKTYIKDNYGTQEKAATKWGVSRVTVNKVLSGRSLPTTAMLDDTGHIIDTKKAIVHKFHKRNKHEV